MRAKAYAQKDCFEAGLTFAKQEGIIPAPEGNHAVKGAIDAALECKKMVKIKLFSLIFVVMVILICQHTMTI